MEKRLMREARAMSNDLSRRQFVCRVVPASAVAAAGLSLEERVLLAHQAGSAAPPVQEAKDPLPKGKIGKLEISRLILGGNLIGGFAHSRDLMYISALTKRYFTDEKVMETLRLAEAHGINTINTNPKATELIRKYWQGGGKIQWIVQGYPDEEGRDLDEIKASIDAGACAVYIQGNIADRLIRKGKVEVVGKVLEFVRKSGLPAGVAGHSLEVPKACEQAKLPVDFYVKTLHTHKYWTAMRPEQKDVEVVDNRADNFWCANPEETIGFMKAVEKPWIAYKVLAAGAIHPANGFTYAFVNGADFVLAGIFDFQIGQDVEIAKTAQIGRASCRERVS
jgi:hypothetical protein